MANVILMINKIYLLVIKLFGFANFQNLPQDEKNSLFVCTLYHKVIITLPVLGHLAFPLVPSNVTQYAFRAFQDGGQIKVKQYEF